MTSSPTPVGSLVRARRRVVDHDAARTWPDDAIGALLEKGGGAPVAAERGAVGRVCGDLGDRLVVAFRGAPCAIEVPCSAVGPFLRLLPGGLP